MSNNDDFRRFFQGLKRGTLENFIKKMNMMHSNAWHKCHEQYEEAMGFALTPKQANQLREAHKKVVLEWDGLTIVEMNLQEISEADFIDVVKENRRIGRERMIELVNEYCRNR